MQSHPNRRKRGSATAVDRSAKLEGNYRSNNRSVVTLDDQRFFTRSVSGMDALVLQKSNHHTGKKKRISDEIQRPKNQLIVIHKRNAYCVFDRIGVASFRAEQRYMKNY